MAIKMKNKNKSNVQINVLEKVLHIAKKRIIMRASPFFDGQSMFTWIIHESRRLKYDQKIQKH